MLLPTGQVPKQKKEFLCHAAIKNTFSPANDQSHVRDIYSFFACHIDSTLNLLPNGGLSRL